MIVDGSESLAAYNYLGESTTVQIQYPLANVMLDLWGGTSGVYNGFDRFDWIIDQRWINYIGGTVDIDRFRPRGGQPRNATESEQGGKAMKSCVQSIHASLTRHAAKHNRWVWRYGANSKTSCVRVHVPGGRHSSPMRHWVPLFLSVITGLILFGSCRQQTHQSNAREDNMPTSKSAVHWKQLELREGLTLASVEKVLGAPSRLAGSGVTWYFYDSPNGPSLWLFFDQREPQRLIQADLVTSDGKRERVFVDS